MTYAEALAALPEGAAWSSSFGYPGEGGYTEAWRMPDGARYWISNGTWLDFAPFNWSIVRTESMPAPGDAELRSFIARKSDAHDPV